MDENLLDATIERQYAAIEELPHLQRCTEAEQRLRSIVLGSPQVCCSNSTCSLSFHVVCLR